MKQLSGSGRNSAVGGSGNKGSFGRLAGSGGMSGASSGGGMGGSGGKREAPRVLAVVEMHSKAMIQFLCTICLVSWGLTL